MVERGVHCLSVARQQRADARWGAISRPL